MIKHIVFMKTPDDFKGDKKQLLNELKNNIEALKSQINVIQTIEVGINVSNSLNAFDISLISDFRNESDLDTYRKHPAHVEVVNTIKKNNLQIAVVDYTYQ